MLCDLPYWPLLVFKNLRTSAKILCLWKRPVPFIDYMFYDD